MALVEAITIRAWDLNQAVGVKESERQGAQRDGMKEARVVSEIMFREHWRRSHRRMMPGQNVLYTRDQT